MRADERPDDPQRRHSVVWWCCVLLWVLALPLDCVRHLRAELPGAAPWSFTTGFRVRAFLWGLVGLILWSIGASGDRRAKWSWSLVPSLGGVSVSLCAFLHVLPARYTSDKALAAGLERQLRGLANPPRYMQAEGACEFGFECGFTREVEAFSDDELARLELEGRTLYVLRERHSLDTSSLPQGVKSMDVYPMQRPWWYVVMGR